MTAAIKIHDLFQKDIRREINGVIKVDQYDEDSIYTELDEYVVTKETLKHLDTFFDRYLHAMSEPTDKTGVWVSGFFGSGKSHFIKMLSYLLENQVVKGKSALDFFREKIDDPQLLNTIEKAVTFGTKDVILFNIDSKANTLNRSDELIVNILMRVLNEKRGFYGDVLWIAEMEEDLVNKDLYDKFKDEFRQLNGESWEEKRDTYVFEQDHIIEALVNCGYQSKESLERLFQSDGSTYHFSVEKFAEKVKKYCDSKGKDHQVIFLIDEIGQYIGENSDLMLNLQTIVEELGTKLTGKAWVVVTSQADIDAVTKEKVKGYDFSKIQGRFDTRLSLSSANVDEVIKKRILAKKQVYEETLSLYHEEKKTILKNLLTFSPGGAEMKLYKGNDDFVDVYPYVPYQFFILQKVFDKIRQTGFTGKHLAKGERSMLSAFKEATEQYAEDDMGILVPFYTFYSTIESFLDPIITRTIEQAKDNDCLEDGDCDVLKILFMIRHVKELQPSLDNLVVLSVSHVDGDKRDLKNRIAGSLQRLESQTLIHKSGDRYYFLTNEEQEINREIKNIDIEKHKILDEIFDYVFESNEICPAKHKDYKFNKAIDDKTKPVAGADLTIKFLTPLSDDVLRGSNQKSLYGDNLSNIDSTDTLLFITPADSEFVDQIRNYLKIDKYLKQNTSNTNIGEVKEILSNKRSDEENLRAAAKKSMERGISEARVFVDGKEVTSIEKKNPKERIKDGLDLLFENVYKKAGYVTRDFESDSEILKVLQADDLEKFGFGRSDTNKLALKEVLDHLNIKQQRNDSVVMQDIKDKFRRKPYGWKELTVSGLVATLFANDEIKLRYQKTYLVLKKPTAEEVVRYLTRKDYADKLVVEIREKPPDEVMRTVRSIMREVFDKTNIPEKENDLLEFTHSLLNEEFIKIEQISGKYEEEKRFPGKDEVKAYASFLKQVLNTTDPSAFLQKISDDKEELVKLRYDVEPVISFFGGQQVEIFRRLLKKIDNYTRDRQFMDDETKSKVRDVEAILGSKEPYSEIKSLPPLEASIESALSAALAKLKEDTFREIESITTELQKYMASYAELDQAFRDSVLKPFNQLKENITQAGDCVFVQAQSTTLKSFHGNAYEKIKTQLQTIREKEQDKGEESITPVRSTRVIRDVSVFKTKDIIRSEEELDNYLKELKASLLKMLETDDFKVL
ncbi:BREX system P-loop protein BrxC [uncultured Methanomethylovorans sp.]|uniref:BREX system P-loop protein BrxC n=1 Tax=uncultured Methanomethylovorans sp. TaxID=183759 RepID=UPI002AA60F0E|nr:BREX system P-loop protein BrxC [uncultured Methanomethylovorans sp.]